MASREKLQADFDLERFIDMFDTALTSTDERVVSALRSLMMMVILTKPEVNTNHDRVGPLRQLYEDLHNLNRRMHAMEDDIRTIEYRTRNENWIKTGGNGSRGTVEYPQDMHDYSLEMQKYQAALSKNLLSKFK